MSEMLFKNLLMKVMSTDEVGQNKQKKNVFPVMLYPALKAP